MGALANIRDRSRLIKALVEFQKSDMYPILFSVLCIISGLNSHAVYIPIMYILSFSVLFSALFTDDNKVFLTPLCMIFFALGFDTEHNSFVASNGDMMSFMDPDAVVHLVIIGVIGVGSFALRLLADGSIVSAFSRRRAFTWGILAMDAAFFANGMFSESYLTSNLGYGALIAMGATVTYFLVIGMLERSSDPIPYACKTTVCAAYVALIQVMAVVCELIRDGNYIIELNGSQIINKDFITLGWGISCVIAAAFSLGIPSAMYLARKSRANLFFYLSAVLFLLGAFVVNVRSAMMISTLSFIACTAISCASGRTKKQIRIYSAITAFAAAAILVYVNCNVISFDELLHLLRIREASSTGRTALWENGIADFKSSPIFGVGFADGGFSSSIRPSNFYSRMYHNILIQFPAAMGIVGCIAFLIHLYELTLIFFKRISADKMLLLSVPMMILGMSLFDNFFFYLEFQIFYGIFLALSEILLNSTQADNNSLP